MAFLGNEELKKLLNASDVIPDYNPTRIKNGAYEMSLGSQVFQTDSNPRSVKELKENDKIEIKPGQFALLLTKEYVKIPHDKIAFISIKAGIKFKGLVTVSGFHVDPGCEGNLLFSVYNAGPSNIVLSNGTAYFPIWFAELKEKQDYKGSHEKQTKIPDEPIEALSQGELASPNVLSKRLDDNNLVIDKRISVLERDQKANNYIAVTAIGIAVAILLKFIFDWTAIDLGFKKGIEDKSKEIISDSIINQQLLEKKQLMEDIDSLERVKANMQESKTKN
jgi:dCTP deaminase